MLIARLLERSARATPAEVLAAVEQTMHMLARVDAPRAYAAVKENAVAVSVGRASGLYLQVRTVDEPARWLYQGTGFVELGRYLYRQAPR